MNEKDIDAAIKLADERMKKAQEDAKIFFNGIKSSNPSTTRRSILDALSSVFDKNMLLGILMQADVWVESLNQSKYLTKPSDEWVNEFDWLRHVLQQRPLSCFFDAVEAIKCVINDDSKRAMDYAEDAGLTDEFMLIYRYYRGE